jgi:RimJ/RimL family protein N-acetyltransferase
MRRHQAQAISGARSEETAPCELLDWDSRHFGFPIARVRGGKLTDERAEAVDEWCREHGIRCLYLCADAEDAETARVAAVHGFRVVDTRVIVRRSYEGLFDLPQGPEELSVREATEDDLDFARSLAARSYSTTRFYFDGNFPRDRCDALYEAWIERGDRDPERRLLIAVVGAQPVGYVVLAPLGPDREGRGELIAIHERHRRKGYSQAMHFGEYRDFAARGALTHRGEISIRNLGNLRLHERLGFVTDEVDVWHHKWFGAPNGARRR